MIAIRALGPLEITVNGTPPPPKLLWKKNVALLFYLLRSPRKTRAREHLVGLLWADRPGGAARHSLREAVRVIRMVAGELSVHIENEQVRVADGLFRLDLDEFEACVATGDWGAAAGLSAGDLLEGFGVPDASPFEDWLARERLLWRRHSVNALVRHADALLQRGRHTEAAGEAQRAFDLDQASEAAARTLMRCLALRGDRSGALVCYDRFAQRLADELRAEPDPDTRALADRIRMERAPRPGRPHERSESLDTRRAPLTGRETELTRLVEAWDLCRRDRRATVAIIGGDAGSGVTRLAEELAARARLDGAAVGTMRAVEADQAVPWSGIVGLARGGLLGAPGLAAASPGALAAIASHDVEWRDRFGTAVRDVEPLPVGQALSDLLRAVTEELPTLLVLDDAQWLDHDSFLALRAAARDMARGPLFLAFGATSHPPRQELDELRARLGRDLAGISLNLAPLGHDSLTALARWALPNYDAEQLDRIARRLAADSAGLPILAVELVHAIAHGLDPLREARAWPEPLHTLTQTLPGDLPDNVTAAIRVGFNRLSNPARKVLAVASVLGDRLTVRGLTLGSGMPAAQLEEALDELEWKRWLAADGRGYTFVARIVKNVVARDMVTPGQRQRILHAAKG